MGTVLTGLTLLLSGENTISGVSTGLVSLVNGTWFGISHLFYFALVLTLLLWYIAEHTITGRRTLFAGLGPVVAQLSGVKVSRLRWGAMTASGFLAALAGLSYVGTIGAADPVSASGFLLPAYAAMFLGATTIAPGRFNAWGTTIATYFLATGFTGLELLGVNSWVQQVFYGGILVVAVALASGGSRLGRKSGAAAGAS
jgi:ribose transport system permease protein